MEQQINGRDVAELDCSICGTNIEDNGGYLNEVHGELVCSGSNDNSECWWEYISQWTNEVYDLEDAETIEDD